MSDQFISECNSYCNAVVDCLSNKKFSELNKVQKIYWATNGKFEKCSDDNFKSEQFIEPLARFFKQKDIKNPTLLLRITKSAPEIFCFALRSSEIFIFPDRLAYHQIEQLQDLNNLCNGTIGHLKSLSEAHKNYLEDYNHNLALLQNQDVIALINMVGIAFYEYQYRKLASSTYDLGGVEFSNIVKDNSEVLRHLDFTKIVSQENVIGDEENNLRLVFYKQLVKCNQESEATYLYEDMLTFLEDYDTFMNCAWGLYSFDHEASMVKAESGYEVIDSPKSKHKWDLVNKKQQLADSFWSRLACDHLNNEGLLNQQFGQSPENSDINRLAFVDSFTGHLVASIGYGISDKIILRENHFSIENMFKFMNYLKCYCRFDYMKSLKDTYAKYNNCTPKEILHQMLYDSFQRGLSRLPVYICSRPELYKIYCSIAESGSKEEFETFVEYFTFNSIDKKDNENCDLFTHPFLQIGDLFVTFPFMFADLDVNKSILQQVIKNQNQNNERKGEVAKLEEQIAGYFKAQKFQTCSSVDIMKPEDESKKLTDMDVVAYKDGHLFLIELKTTNFKTSISEVDSYVNMNLRKARSQLDKIIKFKTEHYGKFKDLLASKGISLPNEKFLALHTYIVDTTFECDHECFGEHLKLSHLELRCALLNEVGRMVSLKVVPERYKKDLENGDISLMSNFRPTRQEEKEMNEKFKHYDLYPNGFSVVRFLEVINGDLIWKGLDLYLCL